MNLHSFADIHAHTRIAPDTVCSVEPGAPMPGPYGEAWYSVGIHPWSTDKIVSDETLAALDALAADPRVVAIGEAGLDALRGGPQDYQEKIFLHQAALAESTGKPLVVHCVRRYGRLMELHRELRPSQLWVVHGFSGKPELARQLSAAGIGISLRSPRPDIEAIVPSTLLFHESDR